MHFNKENYRYYSIILWNKDGLVRKYAMDFLSFEFMEENFDYIIVLKFDFSPPINQHNTKQIIHSFQNIFKNDQNTFVILTNRKAPPIFTVSDDEFVNSFSCSFQHLKELIRKYTGNDFKNKDLLFTVLDQILNGNSRFKKILIKQIPMQIEQASSMSNCDLIIPHRGENHFLENILFFLNQLDHLHIYTGIDQDLTTDTLKLREKYSSIKFYNFSPDPVGPYVVRNYLIDESKNDLIFFQDSDDIPCADRFEKISAHMKNTGCQLCGSHELRIDYFNKTVRAHRFPINVRGALRATLCHPLLHPTSAITRNAFYSCGKLSEERAFGNDTKFLLHSYFCLSSICNIDEFLYIRRRRPNSLTTSPDTMIGSPIREKLLHTWNHDFQLLKYGGLSLENSSLTYERSRLKFHVRKF